MTNQEQYFLYHYTTVETLALILNTKTMRFSSLDTVDDMQETETENLKNAGKYCFASCFTADNEESIPIWSMYSEKGAGIRLKLRRNPFKDEKYHVKQDYLSGSVELIKVSNRIEGTSFGNDFELIEVIYTDDESLLRPNIECGSQDLNQKIRETIGRYKNKYWKFQKEWRYIKFGLPLDREGVRASQGIIHNFLDISLEEEALNNLEITLGYNISPGNELIVKTIVNDYNEKNNSNIEIKNSCLKNKVR